MRRRHAAPTATETEGTRHEGAVAVICLEVTGNSGRDVW